MDADYVRGNDQPVQHCLASQRVEDQSMSAPPEKPIHLHRNPLVMPRLMSWTRVFNGQLNCLAKSNNPQILARAVKDECTPPRLTDLVTRKTRTYEETMPGFHSRSTWLVRKWHRGDAVTEISVA